MCDLNMQSYCSERGFACNMCDNKEEDTTFKKIFGKDMQVQYVIDKDNRLKELSKKTRTPYDLAEIGVKIGRLEAPIIWLLDHWFWEPQEGSNEEQMIKYLCEMTNLWEQIEDETNRSDITLNEKQVKAQIKKLEKAMDFSWDQVEEAEKNKSKNFNQLFEIYQLLGGCAWSYLCSQCKHKFKWNKKHKKEICTICGKVKV